MENSFLCLACGWGLSKKPGCIRMYLNENGSFVIEMKFARPKDQKENTETPGKINEARMTIIKDFLEKNITENYKKLIFDASWIIEYIKGDRKIEIINNLELWKKMMELIPEFNMNLDK